MSHGNRQAGLFQSVILWRHKRRWVRRHSYQMQHADAMIISHTKSGRTWLRIMISHLYHLAYGTPATEIIDFDNLHRLNPAIPRIYFNRDTRIPAFSRNREYIPVPTDRKTLFLVRDPRDVAVSFHFHVCNRASDRELIRKGIPEQAKSLSLYDFVMDSDLGIPRVVEHYNRWHAEMQAMPHSMIARYEELHTDPVGTLARIMRFIDHEFSQDDIEKAVEFASFDSMSHKEKTGFFSSGRMQPTNAGDAGSHKVRRGKVGGYSDYFTREQNATIDALVTETLNPGFGYS
ncbi:MAG: sulfotransferase domain-containing protein [Gammaproteobacteria bacterium]|nr:MAG: sulfotransferase domain-containing protein [Gammaproteobacteria bacterium]